ncbi:MAG: hypothetical protein ACI9WU_000818, partial [Myxococcota bacterium]
MSGLAESVVVDGRWYRGATEIVRRVDVRQMEAVLGRRAVEVPVGSVLVTLLDGGVHELLPPGRQVTIG